MRMKKTAHICEVEDNTHNVLKWRTQTSCMTKRTHTLCEKEDNMYMNEDEDKTCMRQHASCVEKTANMPADEGSIHICGGEDNMCDNENNMQVVC